MKKKLMVSMVSLLIMSVIVLTILFTIILNHQYSEKMKKSLKENNDFVINLLNTDNIRNKDIYFKENFKNLSIRVTYIDKEGKVILDSVADKEQMDNHNNRKEIMEAREKGVGYSIRFSNTYHKNMMYVATSISDSYIIRSSMPMDTINSFEGEYLKYYIIIVLLVMATAVLVASKLSYVIVKPITELKMVTDKVASGELNKRIIITSNDEIGDLGKTFNNMTEKLENTVNDALEKHNRLTAILKSMDSGVIAVDKGLRIIMINPYALEIFGVKKDIIGQNLIYAIRNFEIENIFKESNEDYIHIKIYWPKERELRIKIADIINGEESIGKVAVVQDITDIKKLENLRSNFVANVSHELKTPLTSIKGFSETLKYVDDAETREKFLAIINDEAERLTRLINDILTLSSIEQNKEIKNEEFDIEESIEDVYLLMKNTAHNKNIEINIEGEKGSIILGDRDKFKQMLINLVDNAIKYSELGGKVYIRNQNYKTYCKLIVEDTGFGISKEHVGRLFERFYRVDKARSRAEGGTGLGLAIVKHIVIGLNGNINVESELGKGSKFIITLPLKE